MPGGSNRDGTAVLDSYWLDACGSMYACADVFRDGESMHVRGCVNIFRDGCVHAHRYMRVQVYERACVFTFGVCNLDACVSVSACACVVTRTCIVCACMAWLR